MNVRNLILMLLVSVPSYLFSQTDTTIVLEAIEVHSDKIRDQSIGGNALSYKSEALQQLSANNLSELLSQEAGIYIKSYGLNSLGTSSIRGGSAGHTLVLWNGLPLQSPMLGLLDLSLLPVNAAEEITIQKGGNSANWGTGAIGGIIKLNNVASSDKKLSLGLRSKVGAFGEWQEQVQFTFGTKRFFSSTKLSAHRASNDFSYSIAPNLPAVKQSNAAFERLDLMQDLYWYFKNNRQLNIHFWRQSADREIPPTITQTSSVAKQEDEATRLMLDYQITGNTYVLNSKIGYFNENLIYEDEAIGLEAPSGFHTFLSEFSGQWQRSDLHKFSAGITYNFTTAIADGYEESAKDHRLSFFAIHRFEKEKIQVQTSLRQVVNGNQYVPLVPSLGVNLALNKHLIFKVKLSKNYRLPTLNDRFWQPGGNIDLKAENGWSQEATLLSAKEIGASNIKISLTCFNRNIDNWILWSLQEGQSFWSANNITKVWSRGLEPRFSYIFKKNKSIFRFDFGYDYIRSTNQVALESPRIAKGQQLIYTPIHRAFSKITFGGKHLLLAYHHQYTGPARGINEAIDSFQTGDIRLQFNIRKGISNWKVFFNINNIWNADYFIIERRPMPGRYWQAGLNIQLTK